MKMHNRREDTGCCSRIFLKAIMIVFNIFYWLSGVAFLLIGLGSFFLRHHFVSLLDSQLFPVTTYLFIGTGGLIVVMGAFGCVGTVKEMRGCLLFYAFVLMAVFMLETCVGVLAYMYEGTIHEELSRNLNKTMSEKYSHMDTEVTRAVDMMQATFECCGASSRDDWRFSKWMEDKPQNDTRLVPLSCCMKSSNTSLSSCGSDVQMSDIFTDGCVEHLEKFIRFHLILIGGVGLGLSILQLFGIIFSCCLVHKIKEEISL